MADPLDLVLRGVPDNAGPTLPLTVGLLVPVFAVSGYLAWTDGTFVGLGLAMLGPAAAVITLVGANFAKQTATHLVVSDGTLTLTSKGGLGTQGEVPVEDLLDFKVERGAGRYNQTLELWTRTGPVPIQAGGHEPAEVEALGNRLKQLGARRRKKLGIVID
ncbi:MAG: hypothetical protein EP330_16185 [Deltaproteobacteria bacterium]|nr:MAG: hypothetical protein EP330_16185 [Deltaproteobacteria bacterium]